MILYISCQLRLLGNKFNNCTVQYMQEEVNYDWLYGVQIVSFSIAVDNENNFSRILGSSTARKRVNKVQLKGRSSLKTEIKSLGPQLQLPFEI